MCYIHPKEYYTAMKMNKLSLQVRTQVIFQSIMLREEARHKRVQA